MQVRQEHAGCRAVGVRDSSAHGTDLCRRTCMLAYNHIVYESQETSQ